MSLHIRFQSVHFFSQRFDVRKRVSSETFQVGNVVVDFLSILLVFLFSFVECHSRSSSLTSSLYKQKSCSGGKNGDTFPTVSMRCFSAPAAHSSSTLALFSHQTKTTRKSRARERFCSRSIRDENAGVKPRRDDDDDEEEEVFGGEREMRTSHTNTNATTTHRSKRGRRKKRDILLACGSLLLFSNTSSSQKEEAFAAGMMDFTKQSQSTFQLGPLQVTLQRLRTLRNDIFTSLEEEEGKEGKKNEDDTGVVVVKPGSEEAIARLRNATLDCTSARPALEAYANVRDVCTLSIVLKSVSKKFATEEARERARERKDETVQAFAELERKLRDVNASKEDIDAEFENSRASVKRFAESVLEAFDFSDEEEKVKREAFPDLFS